AKPLHQAYLPSVSLSRINELRRKTVPAQLVLLGALALVVLPAYIAWVLSARIAQAPGIAATQASGCRVHFRCSARDSRLCTFPRHPSLTDPETFTTLAQRR